MAKGPRRTIPPDYALEIRQLQSVMQVTQQDARITAEQRTVIRKCVVDMTAILNAVPLQPVIETE